MSRFFHSPRVICCTLTQNVGPVFSLTVASLLPRKPTKGQWPSLQLLNGHLPSEQGATTGAAHSHTVTANTGKSGLRVPKGPNFLSSYPQNNHDLPLQGEISL